MRRFLILIAAALGLSPILQAHEHAPRVLSPHNADAYSMKTFAEFPRWKDLKGDAKVYEVYKYLADTRTGIFPMGAGAWEGKDTVYVRNELAISRGVGVETETSVSAEAYAPFPKWQPGRPADVQFP